MAKPITLTDGTTLRAVGAHTPPEECRHGDAEGCLLQSFRLHKGELQRRGVWDEKWEPASVRWAAQPRELRDAVLKLLGVAR